MPRQFQALRTLPEKLFQRLDLLKEDNLHGEAYQEAAQALEHDELEQKFRQINIARTRAGYLTSSLNDERRRAYVELLKHAKTQLSQEQYDRLYMCF